MTEPLCIPDLHAKHVLVPVAGSGIGAAAAKGFARQGALVAMHGVRGAAAAEQVAAEIRAAGGTASAGSCVIKTTSTAARGVGGPGFGLYAVTRAGVSNLTRAFAKVLVPEGIRVNVVSPRVIWTRIHAEHRPPEILQAIVAAIPMGCIGMVKECVGTYLFLASTMLAGYVIGQVAW